jgi:hypothetical protein
MNRRAYHAAAIFAFLCGAELAGCSTISQGSSPMPQYPSNRGISEKIGLWVTSGENHLFGLTADGKKVLVTVSVTGCTQVQAVKVDGNQDVWIACQEANYTGGAALQEYDSSGNLLAQYASACPSNLPAGSCNYFWGSGFLSGATGGSLACGAAENYEYSPNPSARTAGTGFICWPLGQPSAGSYLISIWSCTRSGSCTGSPCKPICEIYQLDMDSNGNIYFTYGGKCKVGHGGGIGEVLNPEQASQSIKIIKSGCALPAPGGAYVSNHSSVFNVIDEDTRLTSQFNLPFSAHAKPFRVLGPTHGISNRSIPFSGGFNEDDTKLAIGDLYGWVDVGTVAGGKNEWSVIEKPVFNGLVQGAAYTPSDK